MSVRTLHERFFEKVERRGPDECWPWRRARDRHGYGQFQLAGRMEQAHRVAWTLLRGPIPDGQHVLHRCDTPPCVNPDHLFLGSQGDNVRDMTAKGRQARGDRHWMRLHPERVARGEQNGSAKLTADSVRAIRERYAAGGLSLRRLAHTYGVSHTTIGEIVRGEKWGHLFVRGSVMSPTR